MSTGRESARDGDETGIPLVSVVIPTYGREEALRRAVRGVDEQTYPRLELLVVDDHSPTPAERVLAELSLDRVEPVVIRHRENQGANAARNTGIRAASGELIAFLDDDDEWIPTKIERQVAAFRSADDDVGVVYTGTRYPEGATASVSCPSLEGRVTADIIRGRSLSEFSAVMVRSDVIDEAGLPDERFPSWQDRDWYLRLSRHCSFKPVPDPLTIRHRDQEGQLSENFESKRDVSYPLFLSKHRPLAASYGRASERQLVSSLSGMLGKSAIRNGYYSDARRFLLRAIRHDPFSYDCYLFLLAALGGDRTYRSARRLVRLVTA